MAITLVACNNKTDTDKNPAKDIVKINGTNYTSQDLWNYTNIILWEMEPKDLDNEFVKEKLLSDFIDHKLLLQEAARRSMVVDQNKVDKLVIQLSTKQGAQELKAITGHYNIDSSQVAKLAEERIIVNDLFDLILSTTSYVTEAELKKYYESKDYSKNIVGEAHIMHIFTTDNDTANTAAQELASGILFSEVARKYSEGPEKSVGGDLGFIREAEFPEFFSSAFTLKEGEISPVITSDYGYHIFRMVEYSKVSRNSYENVKSALMAELYTSKRQEVVREFLNALHNNADIQYLSDFNLAELFPTAGK
jgi:parvulin-like peptidyl-prolyl isomerase